MIEPQLPEPDYRALFESAPVLYLGVQPDAPRYTIVAVSDGYARATITKRTEILGRGLFEVFPDNPADPAATCEQNLGASLERVIKNRIPDIMAVQRHDIRLPIEEGGGFVERWWSPVNSPVLGPDGQLIYIIHRVEDVTEFIHLKQGRIKQQNLTAELQVQAEKTESEIFIRGQEIQQANRQLQQANEELTRLYQKSKELDEAKSRFFASVSHELRTPLTLILGPTQRLLASSESGEGARRDLEIVVRNARTLHRHVDDLLDAATLEAGQMQLDYAETDLAWLVRYIAGHFEVLAREKNLGYAVEAPDSLWAVVDPDKLRRILLNLLSNAFKFTPAGGQVRVSLRENGQAKVVLQVADSGPGIPTDKREAVFERFRKLDGGPTRGFPGTGLGLAIAREFTLLQKGSISISEAPEGGALFSVELPRSAPPATPVRARVPVAPDIPQRDEVPQQVEELRGQTAAPLGQDGAKEGGLVLVVEDNPELNRFVVESLQDQHRVVTASDGREGLVKALELRPDLVLTDIRMPELGGDELVQAVRQHSALASTPILVLTARADDELRARLLRAGARDYLTKPFSVEELRSRAANLVGYKLASEKARKEEATLRGIISIATDAIITTDEQQRIVIYNQGAEAIFGWSCAEALGKPLDMLIPERFRRSHRQFVRDFAGWDVPARQMGERRPEIFGLRKNGEEFPAEAAISKITVDRTRLFTVVLRDVSDRVRIEKEQIFLGEIGKILGASLDLLETGSQVAKLAVRFMADLCVVDVGYLDDVRQRTAAHADPAKAGLATALERVSLDRSRPHLAYATLHGARSLLIEEVRPETIEAFAQPPEYRRLLEALDIKSVMSVPMLTRGRVLGALVFAWSRPDRRYGASDLRLAEDLASRAAFAIENAQLYESAQRAIHSRDEVLGVVAHDLRNPLSTITMQAAIQSHCAEQQRRTDRPWDVIQRAATRMEHLIRDLLDIAQLDAGKLSVKLESVPTGQVIAELLETQQPLARSSSRELRIDVPELENVWADRDRFHQVLENLIGNAIKFTPPGGRITVGAAPRDRQVLFWVADTGPGIPAEELPHLFDRFWQAKEGGRGGVGLGLFIVKGLVEAHGGRIWVESAPGSGSTFYFTIPTTTSAPVPQDG